MSIAKTGIWTSTIFQENYGNEFSITDFTNYNTGTHTKSGNNFTITSPVSSSSWGAGINIPNSIYYLPYEYIYRIEFEVNIPTAHTLVIDINNAAAEMPSPTTGNDNDLLTARTATTFSIPANTWTKVIWGSQNLNANNSEHVGLYIYDGIGLRTSGDSAATTWQLRNPKIILYKDQQENASIGKNGITHSNIFYEI